MRKPGAQVEPMMPGGASQSRPPGGGSAGLNQALGGAFGMGFNQFNALDPSQQQAMMQDEMSSRTGGRNQFSYDRWLGEGQPLGSFTRWRDLMGRRFDQQYLRGLSPQSAGAMGQRSMRGPTAPWGSGGGGGEEQLMALLQQLGVGG